MKLLVVGGTRLLGRALVETAREHGHDVTPFNRGLTNSSLFPGLRRFRGDRVRDASLLAGEAFDMVVDVAGYLPVMSPPVVDAVAARAGRHLFVATVPVYADHSH